MFIHNLDPILFDFGFISIRWYSLSYIFGILIGWWYGKKLIKIKHSNDQLDINLKDFDDLISYLIIGIVVGGRFGYVIFYNLDYFVKNPIDIFKIWEGGMSFHGALIGIIVGAYTLAVKRGKETLFFLDIIACVAPIGIFLGRIANFINGELIGKTTDIYWSVVFPKIDMLPRHPSQIYEAILEGFALFLIINFVFVKKNYRIGTCSFIFLITYGLLRIVSEFFREPDPQLGYFLNIFSMGTILSLFMIIVGLFMFYFLRKNEK